MTEKRLFELFVGNHYGIKSTDGEVIIDSIISIGDADVLVDWLNALYDENNQLKQFKEDVFSLLDKEIVRNEEAIEWGEETGADSGSMGFYNNMLKRLKKELME